MTLKPLMLVFSVATFAAGAAFADSAKSGGAEQRGKPTFESLDVDNNGRLSKLEVAALPAVNTNFEQADKNNDLQISRKEYGELERADVAAQGATGASSGASAGGVVKSRSANYSEPMEALLQSAQRLRESIQEMAQMRAGPERERAMHQAKEALLETQRAMIDMPPEIRQADQSRAAARYDDSMDKLMKAADRLRDSIQKLAQEQAGERRNEAIDQANQAIFDTQQAMIALSASSPQQPSATTGATTR